MKMLTQKSVRGVKLFDEAIVKQIYQKYRIQQMVCQSQVSGLVPFVFVKASWFFSSLSFLIIFTSVSSKRRRQDTGRRTQDNKIQTGMNSIMLEMQTRVIENKQTE